MSSLPQTPPSPPASNGAAAAMAQGLAALEAKQKLDKDGPNQLPVSKPRSILRLAGEIASEPMFLLLLACGALYLILGDRQGALVGRGNLGDGGIAGR
ncbi:MAG: hypothetical protein RL748_1854, partial [Pseudomonadota bacterium]